MITHKITILTLNENTEIKGCSLGSSILKPQSMHVYASISKALCCIKKPELVQMFHFMYVSIIKTLGYIYQHINQYLL